MTGAGSDGPTVHQRRVLDEHALEDLQRLFAGEHERRLLLAVLDEGPRRLEDMRVGLRLRDPESLSWNADALHGAAELVGARRLATLCTRLAEAARCAQWEQAAGLVGDLSHEYADVRLRLEAELRRSVRGDQ
jgi:HPt (histidine-containing phosphotransfer) domain-containing protein